jgi:phosphatidylglycerol:prolipoprotein diacylglycerol transferase
VPSVITIPFDPSLGPIHWYGVGYAVAFLVGIWLVLPYGRRLGISEKEQSDFFFWAIVVGLIGGRLYFVLQQPNLVDYLTQPWRIIAVWQGGMAFFGAIIAACSALAVVAWRKGISVWLALDGGALFAGFPQAIGRIGNVVNGDILGPESNLPWATRYTSPRTFAPHVGVPYQPAGFYELLVAVAIGFAVLWIMRTRFAPGTAIISYIAIYALSQFGLFFVRATEPTIAFGLKQAQLTSLVMLLVVVPGLLMLRRRFPDGWARGNTDSPERPLIEPVSAEQG